MPPVELFIDPHGLARWGIRQRIFDGLRPGRLTEVPCDVRRKHELPVEVNSSEASGEQTPERRRYARAPVSPLCDPPLVAEPLHQLTPCGGDAGQVPPGV